MPQHFEAGREISATKPPSSLGFNSRVPPNRSAIARTIEMPKPEPSLLFRPWSPRQKRCPIWDACSVVIPGPRSDTVTRHRCARWSKNTSTSIFASLGEYRIALSTRLRIAVSNTDFGTGVPMSPPLMFSDKRSPSSTRHWSSVSDK